jgi:hypothetical protein
MLQPMSGGDEKASSIIAGRIPLLRISEKREEKSKQRESIDSSILAYYYAALTNVFCQAYLWSTRSGETDDVIQPIIESSCSDFRTLDNWLGACDANHIWESPNSYLYQHIRATWREQVKDWTTLSKGQFQY